MAVARLIWVAMESVLASKRSVVLFYSCFSASRRVTMGMGQVLLHSLKQKLNTHTNWYGTWRVQNHFCGGFNRGVFAAPHAYNG
jgi:hypothetical protein